jgi:hypothetical protein
LLEEAAQAAHDEPWEIDDLLVPAQRLQVELPDTLGATRR